jgi:hypothetical protein
MKTCNLYIIGLDDEMQHRMIVSDTLKMVRSLTRDPGEAYFPRMFFIDDTKEETLLGVINESKYGRPDIIVSVGLGIALGLAELYKKIEPINTIFTGIYDPVAYGLINSLERPGGCMSGVRWELPEPHNFINNKFGPLVPVIKKIFMPYDTRLDQRNYSIEALTTHIAEQFRSLGCEVVMQEVRSRKEALDAVKKHLSTVHAVADFGLHMDTVQEVSYICGMSKRIFISNQGDFGFESGAAITVMPEDSTLLCKAVTQMIRNFWWHRKSPSTHPVTRLQDKPRQVFVNNFLLPYWAFDLLLPIMNSTPDVVFQNVWIGPPIQARIKKNKE